MVPQLLLALAFILGAVEGSLIPEITQNPMNRTVVRNDPVTLDCRASGSAEIEWFKDGLPVKTAIQDPQSHRILLPDGSLFFLRAMQSRKEQDSGVYWCVASNDHGVARSLNATLDIAYMKDDFRVVPQDTDAVLGENITLECSPPKGHPEPEVKWKKNGDNIDLTSAKRIKIDESGNLVIIRAEKKDQGRYQCSAENVAASKITKPIRLKVHDPPFFITQPTSLSAVVGQDILIECQASGDPHPDIIWKKDDGDIDVTKVRIVHGKGLRIENARPSDAGTYVCTAKNIVGSVTSSAVLKVLEPPVISVRPPINLNKQTSQPVQMDCLVAGTPLPLIYWSKEIDDEEPQVMFPGSTYKNVEILSDGTLRIGSAEVENTGHYSCTVVNEAGSAMARSHLLVYDQMLGYKSVEADIYQDSNEARLASADEGVRINSMYALDPRTIKVSWEFVAPHKYVQGYKVWFKRTSDPTTRLSSVTVSHPEANSFVLTSLEEFTQYDVFIQPFYKGVFGRPAPMKRATTQMALPDGAPVVVETRFLNETTMFVAWKGLNKDEENGPIVSYEVFLKNNHTLITSSVNSSEKDIIIAVPDDVVEVTVQVLARNKMGSGPLSLPVTMNKSSLIASSTNKSIVHTTVDKDNHTTITWIVALVSSVLFGLIVIVAVVLYKHKWSKKSKPSGYLATSTSDDFHCHLQHCNGPILRCENVNKDQALWIDRRWNHGDYEKDSNSSEKKLLPQAQKQGKHHCSSPNSDTEYAYVDRHNLSSFTNKSSGSESKKWCSSKKAESPEPYATTDILRKEMKYPGGQHYAAPYVLDNHKPETHQRAAQSCDDLTDAPIRSVYDCQTREASKSAKFRKPKNLMDILPPPPVHPPPPCIGYGISQESVISPKYLFSHPIYQSADRKLPQIPGSTSRYYKVCPAKERHYEQPLLSTRMDKVVRLTSKPPTTDFDRDLQNELENFNEVVTQFGLEARGQFNNDECFSSSADESACDVPKQIPMHRK